MTLLHWNSCKVNRLNHVYT